MNYSLQEIRAKVWIGRSNSSLFNNEMYTKDMERLLLRMWKKYASGKSVDHITE